MLNIIKSKLLTYLFKDWVKNETDIELLSMTQKMLKDREIEVTGIKPIMGFAQYLNNTSHE
jgi:hypothetical protein